MSPFYAPLLVILLFDLSFSFVNELLSLDLNTNKVFMANFDILSFFQTLLWMKP